MLAGKGEGGGCVGLSVAVNTSDGLLFKLSSSLETCPRAWRPGEGIASRRPNCTMKSRMAVLSWLIEIGLGGIEGSGRGKWAEAVVD